MTGDTLPQLLPATQKSDDGEFLHVMAKTTLKRLMDLPAAHRLKRCSTNGLECLDKEVRRRADVVGVGRGARTDGVCASRPNEASIIRLVAAW